MKSKNLNEIEEVCADIIIDELKVRREMFDIDIRPGSKINMGDEALDEFRPKLLPVLNKIINNGNAFVLTNDFLYYLTYLSIRMVDYRKELLRLLNELVNLDDKKISKLYKKHFSNIMYDKYLNDVDPIDNYINRMSGSYKDAFMKFMDNYKNLLGTFVRGYEYDLMDQVSSLIFAKCAKENKLELYDELSKRYFANPRETIDYFSTNGFMTEDHELIDNFDEYIYEDMPNGIKNTSEIK